MANPVEIKKNGGLPFARQLQAFKSFKQSYPRWVGNMAINFYKDSFRRQGFIHENTVQKWTPRKLESKKKDSFRRQGFIHENTVQKWTPRKLESKKKSRRAILVKSGALRRSIRIIRSGIGYIVVGTDIEYAQIHNEGGTIRATQRVRVYQRKAHTRTWKGKRQKVKASTVTAHSRKINTTIPARPFIAPSAFLNKRIEMNTIYQIKRILNIR